MPPHFQKPLSYSVGLPYVQITVFGKELNTLLDTGASLCMINQSIISDLPHLLKLSQPINCFTATKQSFQVEYAVPIHLKIGKFSWTQNFFVVKELPVDAILGFDFIKRTGLVIDTVEQKCSFKFEPNTSFSFTVQNCQYGISPQKKNHNRQHMSMCTTDNFYDLSNLIDEFPMLFQTKLGKAKNSSCSIELTDNIPIRSPSFQFSPPKLQLLQKEIDKLLQQGVIRHSNSSYASPAFLVAKPNGSQRLVVDYRKLNKKVVFDCFPLPTLESAFQMFHGAKIFSVIDLHSAFFQIPLTPSSRKYTAFITPNGLYEFNMLPMGLSIGSQILSRELTKLFGDLKCKYVFQYCDDLIIYSHSIEEHVTHLREVFHRLHSAGFTVNPEKVILGSPKIKFLGHILSAEGIQVNPERIDIIQKFPRPRNLKAVRRFLGMTGFYARFIPNFSQVSHPLNKLKRKNVRFCWTEECEDAFETLKKSLCQAPTLQVPDFDKSFVLQCDASDIALGAVLNQEVDGHLAPIAFASRSLSEAETRYSVYEREILAIVFGCEKFRTFIEHKPFSIQTDNQAVSWLQKHGQKMGRVGRWVMRLSGFKFDIVHVRNAENAVADCLSRMFENDENACELPVLTGLLSNFPASYEDLRTHQKNDTDCKELYSKLKSGVRNIPFSLHKGLVIYRPKSAKRNRVYVPTALRAILLNYYHNTPLGVHLGTAKTVFKLTRRYYWPNMTGYIRRYVRSCVDCQRAKPASNQNIGFHSSEISSAPMERLFIDFFWSNSKI